jgi:hypothetical protein
MLYEVCKQSNKINFVVPELPSHRISWRLQSASLTLTLYKFGPLVTIWNSASVKVKLYPSAGKPTYWSMIIRVIAGSSVFWRSCSTWVGLLFFPYSCIGRAIAQAVSRRLPTAAARVRAQVRSCEICDGQNGNGAGFLLVLHFPLPIFIPPIAPQSPSYIILGWYNRPVVAAVPSGLSLTPLRIIIKIIIHVYLRNSSFEF